MPIHRAQIDALVSYAVLKKLTWRIPGDAGLTADREPMLLDPQNREAATYIGQILIEQNVLSLIDAFGCAVVEAKASLSAADNYVFCEFPFELLTPQEVLAAALAYEADSSLNEAWEMSLSAWILARIIRAAAIASISPANMQSIASSPARTKV